MRCWRNILHHFLISDLKTDIMKKLIALTAFISSLLYTTAALAQSCCTPPPASMDMQVLALNTAFIAAHLSPEPLNYTAPAKGSMIQFETKDAKTGSAYYLPSDQPTNQVVVLYHEWWGLNDYIKQEAEKWQKALGNVDIYAIDLYDGQVTDDPTKASAMNAALEDKRVEYIIMGLISKIGKDKQIAHLGWCSGGSWAFKGSLLSGDQATGCIMYYGFPDIENTRNKELKTDVLYIYATRDKFIQPAIVAEFERQVLATGNTFELHKFDADHAFANPSNPNHDALATEQARQLALAFLKKKFQIE